MLEVIAFVLGDGLPQLGCDGNLAVHRRALLEPAQDQDVFDTVLCVDLVFSQCADFRDAHTGVDAECKQSFVACVVELFEDVFDFVMREDFCLSGQGRS